MHNYISKDRFHKSTYADERELLEVKENGAYTLKTDGLFSECIQDVDNLYTECIQDVYADKNSIDKNRLDKNSINTSAESEKSIFIKLTLNDKSEYEVTNSDVEEYQELYPAVDVKQQLRSMKGWCDANPSNRKTRNGIKRFINGWLSKEQNRASVFKGNSFDANKGLIKGNYDFEELERETKSKMSTDDIPKVIEEKKPESKLVAKMLSLPIGKDFRFAYQGKEFWGTRYEKSVSVMVKDGEFKQFAIEKLEDHIEELPEFRK